MCLFVSKMLRYASFVAVDGFHRCGRTPVRMTISLSSGRGAVLLSSHLISGKLNKSGRCVFDRGDSCSGVAPRTRPILILARATSIRDIACPLLTDVAGAMPSHASCIMSMRLCTLL